MQREIQTIETDILIIGSEGAGARAALAAAEAGHHVTVITKGRVARSGATQCAPGDYSVNSKSARKLGLAGDSRDSWRLHFEDTMEGGKNLNDPELARLLAEGAESGLAYLMELGIPWTWLGRYPGHRFARSAMVGEVGQTGTSLVRGLHRAMSRKKIALLEDTLAVDLLVSEGEVFGCLALYIPTGEVFAITAKAVILATGGGSRIYWLTSGPEEVTGDGIAMAYRAGAELVDMEFVQFSPYTMIWPPGLRGHMSFVYEYFCVLESWLINCYGDRFMAKWDPARMEKSTRDFLSIGMMSEILAGRGSKHGGVYLSACHLPLNLMDQFEEHYFPGLQVGSFRLTDFGVDPKSVAFEVAPGSHFFMGGVRIDSRCATTLPGLFAAGEVAGGVHGANRLSGNALTETQVFGAIAGQSAANYAAGRSHLKVDLDQASLVMERVKLLRDQSSGLSAFQLRADLQQMAWHKAGVIRNEEGLQEAVACLDGWEADALPRLRVATPDDAFNIELVKALETENMVLVLKAIAVSALARRSSCGAHYRSDSSDDSTSHARYVLSPDGEEMKVSSLAVEA